MGMTAIVPITENNLNKLAEAGAKFGMPRSEGWFRRTMFDPTVEDLVQDTCRGHMALYENGEAAAVQGYYYQPIYFRQQKLLGGTGCVMGADAKVGEDLLCVLDANKRTRKRASVGLGNCLANKRSAKVCKVVDKMKEPPYRPHECRVGVADIAVYPITALSRIHAPVWLMNLTWILTRPLSWLVSFLKHFEGDNGGYELSVCQSIDLNSLTDFWNRFLNANDGIISSREPRRLKWLFEESIRAGKVKLIVAERDDRIEGYALLREMVGKGWAKAFEVIDICAVGNEILCLRTLARVALKVARKYRGMKVLFFGCMPNQEKWLDSVFKIRRETDHPFFMYGSRNPEILGSLSRNEGWFFGPLDGERCMGHGGYIDL